MSKPRLRITTHDIFGDTGSGISGARFQAKIEVLDADGRVIADANIGVAGKLKNGVHIQYVDLNDASRGVSDIDTKES